MKRNCIKLFDKVIVLLLSCLGFLTGCDNPTDEYGSPYVEYGVPSAEYELNGTVTDVWTSKPIPNIRVVRPLHVREYGDTTYTDDKGKYHFAFRDFPSDAYQLKFEDIDDIQNGGLFMTEEVKGTFTKNDQTQKGDGHWYGGKFVKTQDIKLDQGTVALYGVIQTSFKP
jgi:putative lipoprotein (rSAM/lipoprotein system)